jgi:hypothetical protein
MVMALWLVSMVTAMSVLLLMLGQWQRQKFSLNVGKGGNSHCYGSGKGNDMHWW